ncbi:MAG TPA: alpha/beta hydrolase-fold protein [Bryobacteraceae bacterium]|nr:alpha/beta hydrolase-fold protein [Bryobacteraceae bacterium]
MSKLKLPGEQLAFLREPREIILYLPPDYEAAPERRYPVLYMHDGQNLFDPATAFAGNDWGLEQLADELIAQEKIEPLIIVGIYNRGEERIGEYTPVKDRRGRGGRARHYGQMIVEDLKPFIDREYRTVPDAANTGLGGSSLGGLVTLYLGMQYPQVFGKWIVMSPSIWWANRSILRRANGLKRKLSVKIWLDTGTCEGQDPEACIRNTQELCKVLVEKGWQMGGDLAYLEDEGAGHNEKAWGYRMRHALQFLFPLKGQSEQEAEQQNGRGLVSQKKRLLQRRRERLGT